MSSSASRRIFHVEDPEEEVFVVGGPLRESVATEGPLTTVSNMLDGAKRRAEHTISAAEEQATAIIAAAEAEAESIRREARAEGSNAGVHQGREEALAEANAMLQLMREAAAEGLAIRNNMIEEAMPAIARAIAMAARRVVGAAYESDPSLTAEVAAEAVRAAAGQQILAIRVSPEALDSVRASLVDVADYVRPDEGVALGGCVIDLRNGTLDATLDARLDLMELALRAAGGGE